VPKFLSASSIVKTDASTGKDRSNKKDVINMDQTKRGNLCKVKPGARMLIIVVIKFMAPKSEAAPDMCKLKIAKSTAAPLWYLAPLRGGYTVHPVPAPTSVETESTSTDRE